MCGIVDVAYLVTIHALAEHDLTTARRHRDRDAAAPYEEIHGLTWPPSPPPWDIARRPPGSFAMR